MTRRLAEVAAYAGVSQSTVSRVINDKPGISEMTKAAVLTALDVLGYERPVKLRGERARLVGLVLTDLNNPVHPAFTESIAGALAKRGFTPILCTRTTDAFPEEHYVDLLFDQTASGAIFIGGRYQYARGPHESYHRLSERGMPAVLVNAASADLPFPRVSIEDMHAVDLAYGHLAALGHTNIALMLGPQDHLPSARRLDGYSTVQDRHGHHTSGLISRTDLTAEDGRTAATRLMAQGATALICTDAALVVGVIRAARSLKLSIPTDVSVIGFDDTPVLAHTDPAVTTIRAPTDAMSQAAVSLLVDQIEGTRPQAVELLFEPDLVVRASAAPPT